MFQSKVIRMYICVKLTSDFQMGTLNWWGSNVIHNRTTITTWVNSYYMVNCQSTYHMVIISVKCIDCCCCYFRWWFSPNYFDLSICSTRTGECNTCISCCGYVYWWYCNFWWWYCKNIITINMCILHLILRK